MKLTLEQLVICIAYVIYSKNATYFVTDGSRVIKSFKAMSIGVVIFDGFEGWKTLGSSTLTGEFLSPNLEIKVTNYCGIHS